MHDQDEPTPPTLVPRIDPELWEDFQGYRETLLLHVTEPGANQTIRRFGALLLNLFLEHASSWPSLPEGNVRSELRVAVADLRHLEGFLGAVG